MLKGLPASGKSSWALEKAKNENYVIISRDEIRKMFGGYKFKREKDVLRIRNELIKVSIQLKRNVIVDDTNLNPKHERYLRQLARDLGVKFEVNDEFLKVPPEECIKRDIHRGEKAVGASAIWNMYHKWVTPDPVEKLDQEFGKPRCVIVGVDETLALNLENRVPYDLLRVEEDAADPFVSCIVDALYNYGIEISGDKYPTIIIVSGREENLAREMIERWLKKNGIPYDELYMRPAGDTRKDAVVKKEIYETIIQPKYAVLGVIDNGPSVCNMWRSLGLRVAQLGNPYTES